MITKSVTFNLGRSSLPNSKLVTTKFLENRRKETISVWALFDSGGQDTYIDQSLIWWAMDVRDQDYNLSTLAGTKAVQGKALGFQAWHAGHKKYLPITALINPDESGTSMQLNKNSRSSY